MGFIPLNEVLCSIYSVEMKNFIDDIFLLSVCQNNMDIAKTPSKMTESIED